MVVGEHKLHITYNHQLACTEASNTSLTCHAVGSLHEGQPRLGRTHTLGAAVSQCSLPITPHVLVIIRGSIIVPGLIVNKVHPRKMEKASSIQYEYRKCAIHARVLCSSKNEKKYETEKGCELGEISM